MELNRNHYFMIGLIFLLVGLQLRGVEAFVLNGPASRFVNKKMNLVSQDSSPVIQKTASILPSQNPIVVFQRTLNPPRWLGWAFVSVGAVLILHSLAMKRPE